MGLDVQTLHMLVRLVALAVRRHSMYDAIVENKQHMPKK